MQIPKGGIAFFDSGIGGLTVLHECRKRLPQELFYYYGDNARAPYGNLSEREILRNVEEAFAVFSYLEVKAVVLACNTVTAVCAESLRKKYPFPIIGAEPAVLPAAKEGGEVLVLSTVATANSTRFQTLRQRVETRYPHADIRVAPCPTLAGEIEKHLTDDTYDFTKSFPIATPKSVVLGCTHYIYLKERIENYYHAKVFDGNEGIAKRLQFLLATTPKPPVLKKDRDGRPLLTSLQPLTDTMDAKTLKTPVNGLENTPLIYFLGTGVVTNRVFYEQMFAIPYNKRDSGG